MFNGFIALVTGLVVGCGQPEEPLTPPVTTPPIAIGTLCVDVETDNATVTIDDSPVADRCIELQGMYNNRSLLKVTAPGFKPFEKEVAPVGNETIQVTLEPEAP